MSRILLFLSGLPSVAASINWEELISKTRELSMSGILGLVDTNLLYAEPGSEQDLIWRLLQSILGIGCLRVLSKICLAPSFEFLHQMYGISPPESLQAREVWLQQSSWTEMSLFGLPHEDTSYHRINQGSGPQAKILWTQKDIEQEREFWQEETPDNNNRGSISTTKLEVVVREKSDEKTKGQGSGRDVANKGKGQKMRIRRTGTAVSEGGTDKWWMDRWQCEVLAMASVREITIKDASNIATVAYFGSDRPLLGHVLIGVLCLLCTAATGVAAVMTNWSWTIQFFALSTLGYFVNRTSTLRSWKYEPSLPFQDVVPELLEDWPTAEAEGKVLIRFAAQSSGMVHLRGVISVPPAAAEAAKDLAKKKKGRYRSRREGIKKFDAPYTVDNVKNGSNPMTWLSYEAQSSFYGLATSVVPDNVALRSLSVIFAIIDGLGLLILGFGGTVAEGWSPTVLGIYLLGIVVAIGTRGRSYRWTMPEFEPVDLASLEVPGSVWERIHTLEGAQHALARNYDEKDASSLV